MACGKLIRLALSLAAFASSAALGLSGEAPADSEKFKVVVLGEICLPVLALPEAAASRWLVINQSCRRTARFPQKVAELEAWPPSDLPAKFVYIYGSWAQPVFDSALIANPGEGGESFARFIERMWGDYFDRMHDPVENDRKMQSVYLNQIRQLDQFCKKRGCKFTALVQKDPQTVKFVFADLANKQPWLGNAATFLIPDFTFSLSGLRESAASENLSVVEYELSPRLDRAIDAGYKLRANQINLPSFDLPVELFAN